MAENWPPLLYFINLVMAPLGSQGSRQQGDTENLGLTQLRQTAPPSGVPGSLEEVGQGEREMSSLLPAWNQDGGTPWHVSDSRWAGEQCRCWEAKPGTTEEQGSEAGGGVMWRLGGASLWESWLWHLLTGGP